MNILDTILDNTQQELILAKKKILPEQLKEMPGFTRTCLSLRNSLYGKDIAVIAEIKKASPSKNVIREDFDPLHIAREYVANGASAISVLTDKRFFQGDIRFIADIRSSVPIPILCKDFITDSYQLLQAKAFGADAVLLIVAALEPQRLKDLHTEANELGLECLVEVHDEHELETLDTTKVKIVGINNRNLSDFTVDTSVTFRVASHIPSSIIIVSESGITSRAEIDHMVANGIHAFLIGESLMKMPSPGKALRALLVSEKRNVR